MTVSKLGIGTVTQGEMQAQTAFSLITAILHIKPMPAIQMLLVTGCYIHTNRNKMVEQAKREGCSHLLFIDTDVIFGPDGIMKLLMADKDIAGGRYNKRSFPIEFIVPGEMTELTSVPFIPTGFLLINMEVFDKISSPWFGFDENTDSDDHYFCKKAIAAGYEIWCEPSIRIGHLGTAIF